MQKTKITWQQFNRDCKVLAEKLKKKNLTKWHPVMKNGFFVSEFIEIISLNKNIKLDCVITEPDFIQRLLLV